MELSNCWPATMRRTARLIPEYRVGCSSKPFLYLTGGRGNTDEYTQVNNKMWIRCIYFCVFSPLNGVVPVFSVFAVRVEKNVLVDSSTEAEHVWCRMFAGLQHLQHHSESLLPVSRSIPPARTCKNSCAIVVLNDRVNLILQAHEGKRFHETEKYTFITSIGIKSASTSQVLLIKCTW